MANTAVAVVAQPPAKDLAVTLADLIARLEDEADRRVRRRQPIEQRWVEDLQQYHGFYTSALVEKLKASGGSQIYMNLTATKTDAMVARLWDLLFPTDDRNWGIEPTPVPSLTEDAEKALKLVDDLNANADQLHEQATAAKDVGDVAAAQALEGQMRGVEEQVNRAQEASDLLQDHIAEAKRRCELMEAEIDDQFTQCDFNAKARTAIEDGAKIGFGVLKGPIVGEKGKQVWQPTKDEQGNVFWANPVLNVINDNMPASVRVDPWNYFPDPESPKPSEGDGDFERHPMTKAQLRKLAKDWPAINKNAIREILRVDPVSLANPTYLSELHRMGGLTELDLRDRYMVWEYTGPVETEEMESLLWHQTGEHHEVDPLDQNYVKIWFCEDKVLFFALHPLDSGECVYDTFTIRADEAGPYGYGIPYIMRNPQAVFNAAYRMMMDNSNLSVGPQIVVDKKAVTPQDGNWTMYARKVWLLDRTALGASTLPPFQAVTIPSNQTEIANIIEMARTMMDETTAMPAIAQGEQGVGVTKTAQGMAMLMNSANVSFRRIVKTYDDDVTIPHLRRYYHWNMQFNPKEAIKGDYEVKARGSGVLMVREMQAQNLLMIAQLFGDHPVFGPMLKHDQLLREIFRAHMIPADSIVKTDREFKKYMAEQAEKPDPEVAALEQANALKEKELELKQAEIDGQMAQSEMEWSARERIANLNYDAQMMQTAEKLNLSQDQLRAKIASNKAAMDQKDRSIAVEVGMAERTGEHAGGAV